MSWRNAATFSRLVGYNLLGFATWLPVVIYFNEHVAETATINGHSMHPFFNTEKDSSLTRDRVLNWKWEAQEGLERGMIVTFMSPVNPQVTSIKRIIGLPGDRIKTKPPFPSPEMVVQPGHVWVEGDGETTLDSNTYGPISIRLITGKITHAIWPLSKMGKIDWRDAPPRREPAGQAGRDTGR